MAKKQALKVKLTIASPEQLLLDKEVDFVVVPALDGDIGVMHGHTPFLSSLRQGRIDIRNDEENESLSVGAGLVQVMANHVTVLVTK